MGGKTADRKGSRQRLDRIPDALRSVPGVEGVAAAISLPGVPSQWELELKTTEGRAETEPRMLAQVRNVTPGYFATLRIPLLAGGVCRGDLNPAPTMWKPRLSNT